mgnify:CR=1 FL=1
MEQNDKINSKENFHNILRLLFIILIIIIGTFFSISRRKNLRENHVIVIGIAIKNTHGTGNDGVEYKFDYQGKTYEDWCFTNTNTIEGGKYFVLCHTENMSRSKLLEKLKNINPLVNLLCLKLNNKIYSRKQIKNIKKLSYIENVSIFHKSMKTLIKMPYYKFNSKKLLLLSK